MMSFFYGYLSENAPTSHYPPSENIQATHQPSLESVQTTHHPSSENVQPIRQLSSEKVQTTHQIIRRENSNNSSTSLRESSYQLAQWTINFRLSHAKFFSAHQDESRASSHPSHPKSFSGCRLTFVIL